MDSNTGIAPNEGAPSNNEPLQNNNPSVANLNSIYPNPGQDRPIINESIPQNNLGTGNNKVAGVNTQNNKSKKSFIIILAGAVVLIGVAAVILVPKLLGSGRKGVQNTLNSIDSILPTTIDSCKKVRDDVEKHNLAADLYEMEISSCRELTTNLYGLVEKLNAINDAGVQEAFNNFKVSLDTNMPSLEKLEDALGAYTAMHNFNVALYNFEVDGRSVDYKAEVGEELINAADNLANSSNDQLSQFGSGVKQAYSELSDAWRQFKNVVNEMGENDPTNYDKYVATVKNFRDYIEGNKPDMSSLYKLANDDNGEISDAFNALMQKY